MSLRSIMFVFLIAAVALPGLVNGCKDNGSQPTNPSPSAFGVSPTSVNLTVGDSSILPISGGTTPYVVVDRGDTSVATASITGTSLRIRAVGVGTSRVIIGDNSTPQLRDSVSVTVSAPVSFANQVQPIFTASCVNAGCHPGGGAPFSLESGQSYSQLVDQDATTGPCAGIKRVAPGNPDNSALIRRLEGTCGSLMPLGGSQLPSASRQLIRDWISQGARNN